MKIKLLLAELKKFNLPQDQYAVFGSGPLAVRGLRETANIDIIVSATLWEKLSKKYYADKEEVEIIRLGHVKISREWYVPIGDIDELIADADIIDSVRFVKLNKVLEYKLTKLDRTNGLKEKQDVDLVRKFLKDMGGR